jgi:hypothetical protein
MRVGLTLEASDLRTAVATALQLVESAVEERAAGIEAPRRRLRRPSGNHGEFG